MQPILVPITSNTWSYKCFPFNSTIKKAQTWSHGVKTWMCSWQVYNVRDPSILGQPPNWGSLVVGAASILGTSKNAEKKGGRAGRVLSEAAHLFAIPCSTRNWNPYCTGAINIIVCVLFIDHGLLGWFLRPVNDIRKLLLPGWSCKWLEKNQLRG